MGETSRGQITVVASAKDRERPAAFEAAVDLDQPVPGDAVTPNLRLLEPFAGQRLHGIPPQLGDVHHASPDASRAARKRRSESARSAGSASAVAARRIRGVRL
jgi:hypothetical protein